MAKNMTPEECYPDLENFPENSVHNLPEDCLGNGNSDPSGGDDCLCNWEEQQADAKSNLNVANAEVSKFQKKVEYAAHWEGKLKVYCDSIEKTNELTNKVARELKGLKSYTQIFCENAGCMVEALEILFCEVKSIYDPCVNEMTILMDKINKCLSCITDPAFDRSMGITKAIDAYNAKLKELAELQKDALKKILNALECANIIFYTICDAEDKDQDFKCDSLENEIDQLLMSFGNCTSCDDAQSDGEQFDPLTCAANGEELKPIPVMPLCKDPYFDKTKKEYDKAKTEKENAKNDLDDAKEKQEAAFICYTGVKNALEASKMAKSG